MDFKPFRNGLPVLLLYNIGKSWGCQDIQDCLVTVNDFYDALTAEGQVVWEACVNSPDLELIMNKFDPGECLVFNWCEEIPGVPYSEHLVAQELDRLGFTFTGSGSGALSLGQDKYQVKDLLRRNSVPTPVCQVYHSTHDVTWTRFPAIVKLAYEHCSYGITRESIAESRGELIRRIDYVLREMHQPALVEEFIDGREFHVGVFGNREPHVLPPAEIDYSHFDDIHDRLCTYESNFDRTSLAYQLTLPKFTGVLSTIQLARLEEVMIAAYRTLFCRDYARMDIRFKDDEFYVLDVNVNPDLSPETSLVLGAEKVGLNYGKFGSLLVDLAAERHPKYRNVYL